MSDAPTENSTGRRSSDRSKEDLSGDSSRSLRIFGVILLSVLVTITIGVYGLKFFQLDNWAYWFFRDAIHLEDSCEVAVVPNDGTTIDRAALITQRHSPLKVPHDPNALVKYLDTADRSSPTVAAHYNCRVTDDRLAKHSGGVVYFHSGWIFGSNSTVAINGVDRVKFAGSDKLVMALNQADFVSGSIQIEIWMTGKTSGSMGLAGRQPATIAVGSVANARIMGLETAVSQMRRLYNLFPVIFLGLICLLAWVYGFRSRLIAATALFCSLSAFQYALYMFAEFFPWGLQVTYAIAGVFQPASLFTLIIFGLVLFGWAPRLVVHLIGIQLALIIAGVLTVVLRQDGAMIYKYMHPIWNSINSIGLMIIAGAAVIRKAPESGVAKGGNAHAFAIFVFVTGVIGVIDIVLDQFRSTLVLSRYIEVFLPLFIGAITVNALSAVDRKYRAERLFRFQIEHDLAIARDIQDSLAPPPERLFAGNRKVECFQVKHAKVAGDWMAVRELADGRLIGIVADATGKGVQAALVVHAVQSLWADTLGEEDFLPEPWIQRVNRVLMRMGEKKRHSLTLGVVILSKDTFEYWSAGHIPLFIIEVKNDGTEEVKSYPARGSVIGLKDDLVLQKTEGKFASDGKFGILLGSDGTFDRGSRTSRREVSDIYGKLRSAGGDTLKTLTADDDRTLVFIQIGVEDEGASSKGVA